MESASEVSTGGHSKKMASWLDEPLTDVAAVPFLARAKCVTRSGRRRASAGQEQW